LNSKQATPIVMFVVARWLFAHVLNPIIPSLIGLVSS